MTDTPRATKKQQELLTFLKDFITEHDYGPSYREIMSGLGYKSVSTVAAHVEGLIAKGYVHRGSDGARSLELITASTSSEDHQLHDQIKALIATTADETDVRALKRTLELLAKNDKKS